MATTACSITNYNILPYPERNKTVADNNYYYIRAREEMNEISEMYFDVLGRPLPRYTANEIAGMLEAGIDAGLICAVLAYTGGAPRPSWAYAKAVIERQIAQGAKTAEDFHGNCTSWRQKRAVGAAPAKTVVEQRFSQRPYDKSMDEFDPELLEEARRNK